MSRAKGDNRIYLSVVAFRNWCQQTNLVNDHLLIDWLGAMAVSVKFSILVATFAVLCVVGSGNAFFFLLKSLAHIDRYDTGDNFVQPTYGSSSGTSSKATVIFSLTLSIARVKFLRLCKNVSNK